MTRHHNISETGRRALSEAATRRWARARPSLIKRDLTVCTAYEGGQSVKEIAADVGETPRNVLHVLKKNEIPIRKPLLSPRDIEGLAYILQFSAFYGRCPSLMAISAQLGIHKTAAQRLRDRLVSKGMIAP